MSESWPIEAAEKKPSEHGLLPFDVEVVRILAHELHI
jgi:hypothetical protein